MKRPRIKAHHDPARFADGRIRIGSLQFGVGSEITDPSGSVWRLLGLLDGTRDVDTVVTALVDADPTLDPTSIATSIDTLVRAGFVEDAGAQIPEALSASELERYAGNTRFFSWIDTAPRRSPYEVQLALKQARVTVLGLGGTGGSLAMSLTAAGIGHLHCVDFDTVELANLNRQLLYSEADIGCPKVDAAITRLLEINSTVRVTGDNVKVCGPEDLVDLMRETDLFVLSADQPSPQIQYWTSEAALRTSTPWLLCAYAGPMVVTGLFVPFVSACYQCFDAQYQSSRLEPDGRTPEYLWDAPGGNAVIAPTANLTGQYGALEAIYLLGGLRPQTLNRVLHQNLMIYDHQYYIEPRPRPKCPMCAGRVPGEARPITVASASLR